MEQCRQFGREALRRSIIKRISRMIGNAGFGSVGGDEFQIVVLSQCQIGSVIVVWTDDPADACDDLPGIHGLLLHDAV
ncbi:hypothetical protein D3C85_1745500 [compost metagenome]